MPDLSVDTVQLIELARRLTLAVGTLKSDSDFSGNVADLVGEHELAERVRSFASSWNDRREMLLDQAWILTRSLDNFAQALDQVDHDSGAAIAQPTSAS